MPRITWPWTNFLALPPANSSPSLWILGSSCLFTFWFFLLKNFHLFVYWLVEVYLNSSAYLFPPVHSTNIITCKESSLIFLISTRHSFWAPRLFLWKWLPLSQVLHACSSIPPGSWSLLLWTGVVPCLCVSSMKGLGTPAILTGIH